MKIEPNETPAKTVARSTITKLNAGTAIQSIVMYVGILAIRANIIITDVIRDTATMNVPSLMMLYVLKYLN